MSFRTNRHARLASVAIVAVGVVGSVACGRSAASPPNAAPPPRLPVPAVPTGGQCDLSGGPDPAAQNPTAPRIFVEVASLAGDPAMRGGGMMAANDEPSTMPDGDLTVTPHVDAPGSGVRLEVAIATPAPPGTDSTQGSAPQPQRVHTTLLVRDQQTIVVGGGSGQQRTPGFAITPYVLWRESDNRRLFECKARSAPSSRSPQ